MRTLIDLVHELRALRDRLAVHASSNADDRRLHAALSAISDAIVNVERYINQPQSKSQAH